MKSNIKRFIDEFCINKVNSDIKLNQDLKNLTTFKISCTVPCYIKICSYVDLKLLCDLSKKYNIKSFCLGGGSKILFVAQKLNMVVYSLSGVFEKIALKNNAILVGAGANMSSLCSFCNKYNLSCVEWGLGIPCSIGGGVYMNAGCFGKSFKDIVESVVCTDGNRIFKLSNKDCNFDYRKSIFQKNGYIILFVYLKFCYLQQDIRQITLKMFNQKRESQPYNYPSVGSIFKRATLPAPIYIEKNNLKGLKVGDAEVSNKHCGFIINKKNARPKQVLKIICKIKKTVWKKDAILLHNEVVLLGGKHGLFR